VQVLLPERERFACTTGLNLEVSRSADGRLVITADRLDSECVARTDAWKAVPIYTEPLDGVPGPVPVAPEKLTPPELMLLDGFCCRGWGAQDEYRHIRPLFNAVASIQLTWAAYQVLPGGDYGLLFPGDSPDDPREHRFWALDERKRHTNAAAIFNPLRGSIIRVNPAEERAPGDLYLEPLALSPSQLAAVQPFLERRKAAPSPAFLLTVHGGAGEPILQGVLFMQQPTAQPVVTPRD